MVQIDINTSKSQSRIINRSFWVGLQIFLTIQYRIQHF